MDVRTSQKLHVIIVSVSVIIGFLFYLFYRPHFSPAISSNLPVWLLASAPSFIFIMMMTSLTALVLGHTAKSSILMPLTWLSMVAMFELLQQQSASILHRGTFDIHDLYAACLGTVCAIAVLKNSSLAPQTWMREWAMIPVGFFALATLLGSGYQDRCDKGNDTISKYCIVPVVLSWQDLRKDVTSDVSGTELLQRSGKIYSLDTWLLVVEKYRGIHIFDVSDQLNPLRLVYIPIAGALDLTIKGSILYSSAFTDLVMIDLETLLQSAGTELVMSRQENVFSYPLRNQFYPERYQMDYERYVNQEDGIVIGYKTVSGKKILYGDEYDLYANEKDRKKDNDLVGCTLSIWLC